MNTVHKRNDPEKYFGVIKYTDDGRTDRLTDGLKFCRFNFLRDFWSCFKFLKT